MTSNANTGMNGFGAIGQFAVGEADEVASVATPLGPPTFSYPNPPGYVPAISLRTWLNPLNLNLLGADKFFGAGPPRYDYPNPRGYVPSIDLKTWVWPLNLNLLGKDKFFGAGGPNYDYPNPRGYVPAIDLKSWIWPRPSYYSPATFFGLAGHPNFDQPNPRGSRWPAEILSYQQGTQLTLADLNTTGNSNFDQSNPVVIRYPTALLTWINQGNIQLGRIVGIPTLAFSSEKAAVTCAAFSEKAAVTCAASDSPSGQNWSGAGYMAKYEIDTSIQIEGVFLNALTGVYIDPTEVQLFILDPSGAIVDHTSLDGSVIRDSLGHYNFTFVVNISGTWTYKWQGTGTAVATSPDTVFTVNVSSLLGG